MSALLIRSSVVPVLALTLGSVAPLGASASAAEAVTVHVGTKDTVRRVVLEETPMPGREPGDIGAVTLAVVVYQGDREIERFPVEGNQGELQWIGRLAGAQSFSPSHGAAAGVAPACT